MTVERWRMPSGRVATIDLRQPPEAVENARRLLREFGDAELINEDAPAAGGNQREGEDQNTHEGEPIMTNSTTTPEHSATDVAEVLRLIDEEHAHVITLEPSHALYQDIADSFTKPLDWVQGDIDESTWVHMVYPIDSEGRRVTIPGDGWWARHVAHLNPGAVRYWQMHPNTAIHVGELLVISLGEYRAVRTYEVDGRPEVEFANPEESQRRKDKMRDKWEAEYAEAIKAAMPALAETAHVWDWCEYSDTQGVMYERDFGPVTLSWPAEGSDRTVRLTDGPSVTVEVGNFSDVVTLEQMRELASALIAAIPVVEEALA